MTGQTYTPKVKADCFTPIQVIGTSQFVLLDIIETASSVETGILSAKSLIRKPRKEDQGQRVPPKVKYSENHAETLGKEGYWTQKTQKAANLGTK